MVSTRLAILWALCAGGAALAMTQAAEVPQLNVKLGLWEVTTHPQVNGNLPITEEQLQKLPRISAPNSKPRCKRQSRAGRNRACSRNA